LLPFPLFTRRLRHRAAGRPLDPSGQSAPIQETSFMVARLVSAAVLVGLVSPSLPAEDWTHRSPATAANCKPVPDGWSGEQHLAWAVEIQNRLVAAGHAGRQIHLTTAITENQQKPAVSIWRRPEAVSTWFVKADPVDLRARASWQQPIGPPRPRGPPPREGGRQRAASRRRSAPARWPRFGGGFRRLWSHARTADAVINGKFRLDGKTAILWEHQRVSPPSP
jgi:hypothetical protein